MYSYSWVTKYCQFTPGQAARAKSNTRSRASSVLRVRSEFNISVMLEVYSYSSILLVDGQVPEQANASDCGFWVLRHTAIWAREGRASGSLGTPSLRVNAAMDLAGAFQEAWDASPPPPPQALGCPQTPEASKKDASPDPSQQGKSKNPIQRVKAQDANTTKGPPSSNPRPQSTQPPAQQRSPSPGLSRDQPYHVGGKWY